MNTLIFKVNDAFHITGRGYVFFFELPQEMHNIISTNDTIVFEGNETYAIAQIERSRNNFGLSKNVGVLIRGDLKYDKNSYSGKNFTIIN